MSILNGRESSRQTASLNAVPACQQLFSFVYNPLLTDTGEDTAVLQWRPPTTRHRHQILKLLSTDVDKRQFAMQACT